MDRAGIGQLSATLLWQVNGIIKKKKVPIWTDNWDKLEIKAAKHSCMLSASHLLLKRWLM